MKLPVVAYPPNGNSALGPPPQTNMFQVRLHPVEGSYHAAGTLPEPPQTWTHQGAAVSTLDITGWKQAVLAVRGGSIWSVFPAARHLHCRVRGSQGTVQSSVDRPNDWNLGRTLLFPSLVAFTTSDGPSDGYIEVNLQPSGLGQTFPCYTLLYKFHTRGYHALGHRERYSCLWLNDAPCKWEQMNPSALWLRLPKWETPTSWSSPPAKTAKPVTAPPAQTTASSTALPSSSSHNTTNGIATTTTAPGGDPRKLHPRAPKLEELDQHRDSTPVVSHTSAKSEPRPTFTPAAASHKQGSSKNKSNTSRPPWFEILQKQGVAGLSAGQISKLRKIGLDHHALKGGHGDTGPAPTAAKQVVPGPPARQDRSSGLFNGDLARQNEILREKVEHMKLLKEQARLELELEEAKDQLAYGRNRGRTGDKRPRDETPTDDRAERFLSPLSRSEARRDSSTQAPRGSRDWDDDDHHGRPRMEPSGDRVIRPLPARSPPMSKREKKMANIPPPGSMWEGWRQSNGPREQLQDPGCNKAQASEAGTQKHRGRPSASTGRIRDWSDEESTGSTSPREPAAPKKSVTATNRVPLAAASRWPKLPQPVQEIVTPPADGDSEAFATPAVHNGTAERSSDPRTQIASPPYGERASSVPKSRVRSSVDRALQPLEEGQISTSRPASTPSGPRGERSSSYDGKARRRLTPRSQYLEHNEGEGEFRRAMRLIRRSSDAENGGA